MKSFPLPATVAALVALAALPFSAAAAGTLLMTAGLGSIIHADYVQRHTRLRLPRRQVVSRVTKSRAPFCCEERQLAA